MAKGFDMSPVPARNGGRMIPNAPTLISWPWQEQDDRMETVGSGHLHYSIQAYHSATEEGGLTDVVPLNVEVNLADVPDGPETLAIRAEMYAISRAQTILQRRNYRVQSVTEICQKDTALRG